MRTLTISLTITLLFLIQLLLIGCTPIQAPPPTAADTSGPAAPPAAGATMTNPKDGADYVYVPAGTFVMGSAAEDAVAYDDEKPQTEVTTDGFWIMRNEVTNAQYMRCVEDKACTELHTIQSQDPLFADYPVTSMTWQQASDYATWAGGRLPTEAEWEKACRGADGRLYPWGNQEPTPELAKDLANMMPDSNLEIKPVGSFPQGASPYGALDMAGNVWEWTSTAYQPYPYDSTDGREGATDAKQFTLRGGGVDDVADRVRCAARSSTEPATAAWIIGFRVVSSGS